MQEEKGMLWVASLSHIFGTAHFWPIGKFARFVIQWAVSITTRSRKGQGMPQEINGFSYYKLDEVSKLARINARTLRRWIAEGQLADFLFAFRETMSSMTLYRLEPPGPDDEVLDKENSDRRTNIYRLAGKGTSK